MSETIIKNEAKVPAVKKEFLSRNNTIVIVNLISACALLFCCCFYFFSNMKLFWSDLTSYMFFSPIILVAGLGFVCFYIIYVMNSLMDEDEAFHADRFDLAYRIIFSVTVLVLIIRSFLGDFMHVHTENCVINGLCTASNLNVPTAMVMTAILSGIVTWCTPRLRDNDNTEF